MQEAVSFSVRWPSNKEFQVSTDYLDLEEHLYADLQVLRRQPFLFVGFDMMLFEIRHIKDNLA